MPLFKKKDKSKDGKQVKREASKRNKGGGGSGSGGSAGGAAAAAAGNVRHLRVQIPNNVRPGEEFLVSAGSRRIKVRCPPDSKPGEFLQVTAPKEEEPPAGAARGGGGPKDSPNVTAIPNSEAYNVVIPQGGRGGKQFPVTISGNTIMVTCPPGAVPGMSLQIVPPPPRRDSTLDMDGSGGNGGGSGSGGGTGGGSQRKKKPAVGLDQLLDGNDESERSLQMQQQQAQRAAQRPKRPPPPPGTQRFEVTLPRSAVPGRPFALLVGGIRVLVTCPRNARPGQKVRFNFPKALLAKRDEEASKLSQVKLSYDKDGWTRTIRVTDMKFQWVRMDDKGSVDTSKRFDAKNAAYVRQLRISDAVDGDPNHRVGEMSLVTANDPRAVTDSRIRSHDGRSDLVSYSDIAVAQGKAFEDKAQWFYGMCDKLRAEWSEGHLFLNVRRDYLLADSIEAVMSLGPNDLRKIWRFQFLGEEGIDAGGLAREWFQIVTTDIFDADLGLWQPSSTNQMCMQINPASEFSCDDHLKYFRFLGRIMGKALFDMQLVAGHMVQYLYKHILSWPCQFHDLENIDEEFYNNLKQLLDMEADQIEYCCLDFTMNEDTLGVKKAIELIDGGADVEVTGDNLPEYLEACFRYRMMGRVKSQMTELMVGFFDVIPEELLTVFDFQELELLMCGMPEIDMDDWKLNTEYSGEYERVGQEHETVLWFWEVVEEFDQEMKARLLQFVTATSGVPARGFAVLQGNDGNVRRFTIEGVDLAVCLYPRAHTCFNRIDLPLYNSKEDLKEKLVLAVTMCSSGFDIE